MNWKFSRPLPGRWGTATNKSYGLSTYRKTSHKRRRKFPRRLPALSEYDIQTHLEAVVQAYKFFWTTAYGLFRLLSASEGWIVSRLLRCTAYPASVIKTGHSIETRFKVHQPSVWSILTNPLLPNTASTRITALNTRTSSSPARLNT
jgi:hypothetical protein